MTERVIKKVALIDIDESGKILSTRSRGKDKWYIPGGKPEAIDVTDEDTLRREIREELGGVALDPKTLRYFDTFEAPAHGQPEGTIVQMVCYMGDCVGEVRPASEIEEIARFSYTDRDKGAPVDQIIFDRLHQDGLLK